MMKFLWYVLAICSCASLNECAKILTVFPFPTKSHAILGDGFVRILLEAGHEVTYVTPFPKNDTPYLRHIDVSANLEVFTHSVGFIKLELIIEKKNDPSTPADMKVIMNLIKTTLESGQMKRLTNDPNEKFDLVIVEWMASEPYAGLAAVFDCPYIWSSSVIPHSMVLQLIDEKPNPSYTSDFLSSNIPPLNFFQRIQELFNQQITTIIKAAILDPYLKHQYYDIFGPVLEKKGRALPSYEDMIHSGSLMFGNSDVSIIGRSMNVPENYKHVAGYHIDPNVKPLPEDLKEVVENAKDGVIYFSLGSAINSKDFPDKIKQSLLKMFGGLKYTILWKFEEKIPDLPKNVHILQWAPQTSILSHPNCKLFITHGGLLSIIESINFGVPIIGIPGFGDQYINVEIAQKKGFALRVDFSYEMADDLQVAIEEILGNPKYKQKMDELNFIFHDRPVTPAKEVAHWVNHVIRTKGAPHLRSLAVMMPWYQKYYVDFLALVLVVLYIVVKGVKRLCCLKKKIVVAKKNN